MKGKIIKILVVLIISIITWVNVINDTNYLKINSSANDIPEYVIGYEDNYFINPKTGDIHSRGDEYLHFFIAMIVTVAACVITANELAKD